MHRFWLFGLLLALVGCREHAPPDGAVRVSITYGSYKPQCLRVSTSDSLGHGAETDVPQGAFKNTNAPQVTVAVFRKPEWEHALSMTVSSYTTSANGQCSGSVLEQHSSPAAIEVPAGTFATFDVTLEAKDDDQDGSVLKTEEVAGTDCNDNDKNIHPGLPEDCNGTVDTDCDGASGCADTECLDKECDDHDLCTTEDHCGIGANSTPECIGKPTTCTPPSLCYTSNSVCDPGTGQCVNQQQPPGTGCNDGNACTTGDQCGADASCQGTPSVTCNSPPTVCYEDVGTCNTITGGCMYTPKAASTSCDDSDACTENDTCNGGGTCAGIPLPPCPAPTNTCLRSDRTSCPSSAVCVETPDSTQVNMPCTDTGTSGTCRPNGSCKSFPYDPSNFDPDSIQVADRGLDVDINCGSAATPVVLDPSSTPPWSAPAGCTLPTMPTPQIVGNFALVPIHNLTIDASRVLKIKGNKPVILAVYGDAILNGDLLADADLEVPGPGGNRADCITQNGGGGQFSSGEGSGGGGGGFGTAGAGGGKNDSNNSGGGAGLAVTSTLVPLVGGCPGGTGGSATNGGAGGGGGGALQISAAGTLHGGHWISVSGGGARGGKGSTNNAGGGGGGGSGGGLLLEAFHLEFTSQVRLTANGGAGAEGGDTAGAGHTGTNGDDGSQSSKDPAQCSDVGGNGADGGNGSSEGSPTAVGGSPGSNNAGAGGGGGGMGVIRLQGFGHCLIDSSCGTTDNNGCDFSPKVTPLCPP